MKKKPTENRWIVFRFNVCFLFSFFLAKVECRSIRRLVDDWKVDEWRFFPRWPRTSPLVEMAFFVIVDVVFSPLVGRR